MEFLYDASGNRIAKIVKPQATLADASTWTTTYYMRDAQGNVMSTYELAGDAYSLKEQMVYGSSRLAVANCDVDLTTYSAGSVNYRTLGKKFFELSNHLGNVLTTVSDRKLQHSSDATTVDYNLADIQSSTDYGIWGDPLPGRNFVGATGYRYGFNGKEKDDEANGNGNQYDYGFRIYNPRLGRFLSTDPLSASYPWYTPYQFAGNKPIWAVDLDGLEELIRNYITENSGKIRAISYHTDVDEIAADALITGNHLPNNGTFGFLYNKDNERATGIYTYTVEGKTHSVQFNTAQVHAAETYALEQLKIGKDVEEKLYKPLIEGEKLVGNLFTSEVVVPEMTSGGSPGNSSLKAEDKAIDIELKMKPGWTSEQKAAAIAKAEALTKAETRVVKNPSRMSNTRSRFKEAGGEVSSKEDVDHTVDLQLGGADEVWNMKGLDRSVNRSMGAQIQQKIKDLPEGTKIGKVTIKE